MSRTFIMLSGVVVLVTAFVVFRFLGGEGGAEAPVVQYKEWVEYTPKSGKFSVFFPVAPKHMAENSRDPQSLAVRRYNIYLSEQLDSTAYVIMGITYPEKFNPEKSETALTDAIAEIVSSNSQNVLEGLEETKFLGHKAVFFKIKNPNTSTVQGVALVANKTLYILTRVSTKKKESNEDFTHFIQTFKLLSPKEDTR